MSDLTLFQKAQDLIGENKLDEAVDYLESILDRSHRKDLAALSARMHDLRQREHLGTIDAPDATVQWNAIRYALLGLTEEVREPPQILETGGTSSASQAPVQKEGRINLLTRENGVRILEMSNRRLERLIDGAEKATKFKKNDQITFGFKDGKPALFDLFTFYIGGSSGYNTREFELLVSDESPIDGFRSIGMFTTYDGYLPETPYQLFRFPKQKAKYFRLKLLSYHSQRSALPQGAEVQLWGELA